MLAPIDLCYVGSYYPLLCQLLLSYAVSAPIILCYVVSYCPLLWRLLLPYAIKLKKIQNVVILGFFYEFWLCFNFLLYECQHHWANFLKGKFCQFRYFLTEALFQALY